MKTLTLSEVIEILADCSAVIVDDAFVTFPNVREEPEDRIHGEFLEIESMVTIERFKDETNATATVDKEGRIVLVNTRGEKTKFMPLYARPV